MRQLIENNYLVFLVIGALICATILMRNMSRKKQQEVDDNNDFMYNKKEHEFFEGKNKPEVDFKGRLINMDEHLKDVS
jgi:hypothetical protein